MDTTLARLRSLIHWEDTFLALVVLAVLPVLDVALAGSGGTGFGARAGGPITGVFVLVAIGGVIACLFTRSRGTAAARQQRADVSGLGAVPARGGSRDRGHRHIALDRAPQRCGGVVFLAVVVSVFATLDNATTA
jgi:hypothetical protein